MRVLFSDRFTQSFLAAPDRVQREFGKQLGPPPHGFRLLSAYRTAKGVKLWVITEANRSVRTILLPEEY